MGGGPQSANYMSQYHVLITRSSHKNSAFSFADHMAYTLKLSHYCYDIVLKHGMHAFWLLFYFRAPHNVFGFIDKKNLKWSQCFPATALLAKFVLPWHYFDFPDRSGFLLSLPTEKVVAEQTGRQALLITALPVQMNTFPVSSFSIEAPVIFVTASHALALIRTFTIKLHFHTFTSSNVYAVI